MCTTKAVLKLALLQPNVGQNSAGEWSALSGSAGSRPGCLSEGCRMLLQITTSITENLSSGGLGERR